VVKVPRLFAHFANGATFYKTTITYDRLAEKLKKVKALIESQPASGTKA
jgi:hypothetical protein